MYKTNLGLSPLARVCETYKTNPGLSPPARVFGMYKTNPGLSPLARVCGIYKTNPSGIWQVANLDAILRHEAEGKRILRSKAKLGLTDVMVRVKASGWIVARGWSFPGVSRNTGWR
jgi:hypothetical protein